MFQIQGVMGMGARNRLGKTLSMMALAAGLITVTPVVVLAQAAQRIELNLPAQDLNRALLSLADRAGIQIIYDSAKVQGLRSTAVSGSLTPQEALARMLEGTGYTYSQVSPGRLSLVEAPRGGGTTVLPTISVEGARVSQDLGRTEGIHSYASPVANVGSKTPAAIREIPQSVSVVTRDRMDDRNMTTLQEALSETTGVRVQNFDSTRADFYARGNKASIWRDGVKIPDSSFSLFEAGADLAIYDRVEVLRGPAGLFQGAGEPGGAINLVRKRPLDAFQLGGKASYGSWEFYRAEADVSTPLVESGKLRGRFVAVGEDRESFVDVYESQKRLAYGTLEADLTENTTFSLGSLYQTRDATAFSGNPIAYTNGQRVDLPRNLFIGVAWAKPTYDIYDNFAELEHRFEGGAVAKLSGRFVERTREGYASQVNTAINPTAGTVTLNVSDVLDVQSDYALDGNVSVPVTAFGQEQKFLFGADYNYGTLDRESGSANITNFNAFSPNHHYPKFSIPRTSFTQTDIEQIGTYSQARLKPGIDWMTFVLGGRVLWHDSVNTNKLTQQLTSSTRESAHFTPSAGVVVDLNKELSVYGSYAGIFQPQTELTPSQTFLPPREGEQYELGLKGEFMDGRLLTHLAVYQIEDTNRATTIQGCTGNFCSEAAGQVRSRGLDAEVSGEVQPGWKMFAGYNFNNSTYIKDPTNQGNVFNPFIPKHTLNLSTKYTFLSGPLQGFNFGGSMRAVGKIMTDNRGAPHDRFYEQPVAVFNAGVGYDFSEKLSIDFVVNNIFDREYYERLSNESRNNRWGEPRAAMLFVTAKW
jgi:outer membrane receptor for ferric coprogen and ferric-rhodotorulic acid